MNYLVHLEKRCEQIYHSNIFVEAPNKKEAKKMAEELIKNEEDFDYSFLSSDSKVETFVSSVERFINKIMSSFVYKRGRKNRVAKTFKY